MFQDAKKPWDKPLVSGAWSNRTNVDLQTANLTTRPWSRQFLTFAVHGNCRKTVRPSLSGQTKFPVVQKRFVVVQDNLELWCSLSARLRWLTRRAILMTFHVACLLRAWRSTPYIALIWQKILITEERTQAAKFTSLSNHHFPRRALYAFITNLRSDVPRSISPQCLYCVN